MAMASFYASVVCATVAGFYYAGAVAALFSGINGALAPVFGG